MLESQKRSSTYAYVILIALWQITLILELQKREMDQNMFLDFKKLQKQVIKNRKTDSDGHKINWLKIVWLQFRKSDPSVVFYKYEMDSEEFSKFEVGSAVGMRKSQRIHRPDAEFVLKTVYHKQVPICEKKLKNLMELCSDKIINENYHSFYKSLVPSSQIDTDRDSSSSDLELD